MRPLKLFITLFWLITAVLLINRYYRGESPQAVASELPASMFTEKWMGIYKDGKKIGWSSTKLTPIDDGYGVSERAFLRLAVMGEEKAIDMSTDASLTKDFKLRSFGIEMKSDVGMKISGTVEGKTLSVVLDSAGIKTEQKINLKDEPYLSPTLNPFIAGGIGVGKKVRLPMIEPSSVAEGTLELEVIGKETVGAQEAYKIKGSFKGAELFIWVTDEGETLKEESGGLMFIREDETTAKNISGASFDAITGMAIPFDMALPDNVSYLKVRIGGIDTTGLELDGGTQRLTGNILEVSQTPFTSNLMPRSNTEVKESLSPTLFVQSNDPAIVSKSKEIVGGAKEPLEKARLIFKWVFENIDKSPTITVPSATEVLKSRRGDCNEHTTLFVALARASGIPSRIAAGVVYRDKYFYYHAWPEVHIGKWLPVDPTFGQWPADATHIRLLTGDLDNLFKLNNVIGKLKIEGLEYRSR